MSFCVLQFSSNHQVLLPDGQVFEGKIAMLIGFLPMGGASSNHHPVDVFRTLFYYPAPLRVIWILIKEPEVSVKLLQPIADDSAFLPRKEVDSKIGSWLSLAGHLGHDFADYSGMLLSLL